MLATSILFLPLIGFIITSVLGNKLNVKFSQYITSGLLLLASIFSWVIFLKILNHPQIYKIYLFHWISSGNLNVNWGIRIDTLTAIMLIVVTNISAAIHIYSIGYMSKDKSIPRFMGYLSLFTFFMLSLITSDNLLQMFFGWEGVGLSSYLLIGFWHHKQSANNAAIKAFIVNRVGDFGFLLGIAGVFFVFDSIYFDEIFSQARDLKDNKIYFLGLNISTLDTLCMLLFIGAMGKSAQIGLHTWLPDAMEGPTPVSALIHAATMVTAGVFMVARMSPLFIYAEFANFFVTLIGALTAIFAATIAITQNDIKRIIAYSTCSQLGYMFFAAGLGAYNSSIFHLMTHGFFKALLFLCAGSVIHAMQNEQDIRQMGGLAKKIPVTATLMWIGSLAIIGFPLFSGYYSKESILSYAYFNNTSIADFAYIIGILTAFLTALYSWRLLFLTFHGKTRASNNTLSKVHESPLIMLGPLFFLAFCSIVSGMIFNQFFIGQGSINFWNNSIILNNNYDLHVPLLQNLLIKLFSATGIILAAVFYIYKTNFPNKLVNNFKSIYLILFNKWYVDDLYNKIFVNPTLSLADIFWKKTDERTIDAFGPKGISYLVKVFANFCSKFQTGYLYHYAFTMLIGLVMFLTWYLF